MLRRIVFCAKRIKGFALSLGEASQKITIKSESVIISLQRIKSEKTMKPNFENLLSLVQKGTSVEFNPEILSFNNVRRIVQEAASHTSCKVTLRNTDAFSPDNWVLLAEEAKGHLAVVFD